jgi:hypothetical protein
MIFGHSAVNKSKDNEHFPGDVEDICNAWTSAVPGTSLPSCNSDKTSENAEKFCWGEINFENWLQIQGKPENAGKSFECMYFPSIF